MVLDWLDGKGGGGGSFVLVIKKGGGCGRGGYLIGGRLVGMRVSAWSGLNRGGGGGRLAWLE